MKIISLLLLTLKISFVIYSQEKITFHKYSPTASSWKLLEWNIKDTAGVIWVLQETINKDGRVKELQFLKNNNLITDILCYLANRITYEYGKNIIIERYFQGDNTPVSNECEIPYKTVYHLEKNYIKRIEVFRKFDTINCSKDTIDEIKKYVSEYNNYICNDSVNSEISYYYYSYAKLNGIYPVNHGYKFKEGHYYYDKEPAKSSIIRGIKNISKSIYPIQKESHSTLPKPPPPKKNENLYF